MPHNNMIMSHHTDKLNKYKNPKELRKLFTFIVIWFMLANKYVINVLDFYEINFDI